MTFVCYNVLIMRNLILKSFETFIAQPLSILRNKIIRIASLRASLADTKSISVDLFDDTAQVNIYNNDRVYNLLSAVVHKRKMHQLRTVSNENKARTISAKLSKS